MTIEKMTPDEKNKFWRLFMGKCWHEWELDGRGYGTILCIHCCASYDYYIDSEPPEHLKNPDYYSSLSGFQIIKEHVGKELPEVWEDYLEYVLQSIFKDWGENGSIFDDRNLYTEAVNYFLNLDNLLAYLLEHTEEWGWVECIQCKGMGGFKIPNDIDWGCPYCNCTGKVQHPALLFVEGLCNEKG